MSTKIANTIATTLANATKAIAGLVALVVRDSSIRSSCRSRSVFVRGHVGVLRLRVLHLMGWRPAMASHPAMEARGGQPSPYRLGNRQPVA